MWVPQSQGTQIGDRGQTAVSGCGNLRDRVHREKIGGGQRSQGTQRGDGG